MAAPVVHLDPYSNVLAALAVPLARPVAAPSAIPPAIPAPPVPATADGGNAEAAATQQAEISLLHFASVPF